MLSAALQKTATGCGELARSGNGGTETPSEDVLAEDAVTVVAVEVSIGVGLPSGRKGGGEVVVETSRLERTVEVQLEEQARRRYNQP